MATEATISDVATASADNLTISSSALQTITVETVYLMGFSFIIGSLFTILMLLILDFMKHMRESKASAK